MILAKNSAPQHRALRDMPPRRTWVCGVLAVVRRVWAWCRVDRFRSSSFVQVWLSSYARCACINIISNEIVRIRVVRLSILRSMGPPCTLGGSLRPGDTRGSEHVGVGDDRLDELAVAFCNTARAVKFDHVGLV